MNYFEKSIDSLNLPLDEIKELSLISKSCFDRQKIIRDTVSTQKNPCVLREILCRHRKYLCFVTIPN